MGLYPTIEELKGDLIGDMTITDIEVTDEFKQKVENGEGPEGCDLATLEEMKGKKNPMKLTFDPTNATGGYVTMNDGDQMLFSYHDGKIEITITDDDNDMDGKIFIDATKKEDGTIVLGGKMYVDYMEGGVSVKGDVNVQK